MKIKNENITTYFIYIFIFMYILFHPFYFWPSGIPQIADFLGLILIFSIILIYKKISINYFTLISILLMIYILLINFLWGLILNEQLSAIISSSWYVTNILLMLTFIVLLKESDKFLNVIKYAVIATILVEYIIIIGFPSPGLRAVGTFNNPNQLGYFSILYLTLFYLIIKKNPVSSFVFWLITIVGLLISFHSLSKAAILSIIILTSIEILNKLKKQSILKVLIITMFLLVIGITFGDNIVENIDESKLYKNVEERLLSIGTRGDDTAAGRGYDRITNHPEYLIFGAGEMNNARFESNGGELHSSLGSLLFSYGIIGLFMFLILLIISIKDNSISNYYVLIPIFMYSLTHMGLRNPIFWIVIGIIYVSKLNSKNGVKYN